LDQQPIAYRISPPVTNDELNAVYGAAWRKDATYDFQPALQHSLAYVCAYADDQLIGFVNLAWDGGVHAFILDTTVHGAWQRQGIGLALVKRAVTVARERSIEWVHVDFEPHLLPFYRRCGFGHTEAGLLHLDQ
jgi:GNAT superfamily N-acetyltransferase